MQDSCLHQAKRIRTLDSNGALFRSLYGRQLTGRRHDKFQLKSLAFDWKLQNEYFCGNNTDIVPLLAVKFCRSRASGHLLAVVDEKGFASIIDTRPDVSAPFLARRAVHDNAAFDVCWNVDSTHIATASGDYSVCVLDAVTGTHCRKFVGHFGSVKVVRYANQSADLLVSGGRDGSALIWDVRSQSASPVMSLRNIHLPPTALKATPRSRKALTASASVTSAAFWQDDSILITGGGTDGEIKMWDCRRQSKDHEPVQALVAV